MKIVLALACSLGLACPARAQTEVSVVQQLNLADGLLKRAEESIAQIEAASSGASCRKALGIDAVMEMLSPGDAATISFRSKVWVGSVMSYLNCATVAEGGAGLCGKLKRAGGGELGCVAGFSEFSLGRALILREPAEKLAAACLRWEEAKANVREQPLFKPEDGPRACALWASPDSDPMASCRKLGEMNVFSSPERAAGCPASLRYLRGEQLTLCDQEKDEIDRRGCVALARLRRSLKGGAEACGDSALCRAMAGQGVAACEPLLAPAREDLCAKIADPAARQLALGSRVQLARSALRESYALLRELESSLGEITPAMAGLLDKRHERGAALQHKLDRVWRVKNR